MATSEDTQRDKVNVKHKASTEKDHNRGSCGLTGRSGATAQVGQTAPQGFSLLYWNRKTTGRGVKISEI